VIGSLSRRARHPLAAALLAALCLLALAAPAPASTPARIADASYLAGRPGGLALAVVVRDGRLQAYACDGTRRRAYFSARARRGRQTLRNDDGARLTVRLGARSARATLALPGAAPLALTARRTNRVAIVTVTIRPDGIITGTAAGGGALGAHLSPAGLFGALAQPGRAPRTLIAPGFAAAPLHLDGTPGRLPARPGRRRAARRMALAAHRQGAARRHHRLHRSAGRPLGPPPRHRRDRHRPRPRARLHGGRRRPSGPARFHGQRRRALSPRARRPPAGGGPARPGTPILGRVRTQAARFCFAPMSGRVRWGVRTLPLDGGCRIKGVCPAGL
jgi:hypothetical protein